MAVALKISEDKHPFLYIQYIQLVNILFNEQFWKEQEVYLQKDQ